MHDSFSRLIYDGYRRKNWCKKGNGKKVRRNRRQGRLNVMGGLRYSDKKRFVEFLDISNADNSYKFLKSFDREPIYNRSKQVIKRKTLLRNEPK